jgi:hypothetical protein
MFVKDLLYLQRSRVEPAGITPQGLKPSFTDPYSTAEAVPLQRPRAVPQLGVVPLQNLPGLKALYEPPFSPA